MEMTTEQMLIVSAEILAELCGSVSGYSKDSYELADSRLTELLCQRLELERVGLLENLSEGSLAQRYGFMDGGNERAGGDYYDFSKSDDSSLDFLSAELLRVASEKSAEINNNTAIQALVQNSAENYSSSTTETISEHLRRDSRRYDAELTKY